MVQHVVLSIAGWRGRQRRFILIGANGHPRTMLPRNGNGAVFALCYWT
jgi:hypothetical protein